MYKRSVSKLTLLAIEKAFGAIVKPFANAENLANYSTRGYYLLGLLLAGTTLIIWWWGFLSTPLSQSNIFVQAIYKSLIEKTVFLNHLPDSYLTLAFLPAIFYVIFYFWPSVRSAVGELTANVFFWTVNKGITLGEWCIEHRWHSFVLIIVLTFALAATASFQVQEFTNNRKLRKDFEYWLKDVEHFVTRNPVTKPEIATYRRVHSYWRSDFSRLLELPNGGIHPALCLNKMLDELYLEESQEPWSDTLQRKLEKVSKVQNECSTDVREGSEIRTQALIHLFIARINVRISQDADNLGYASYEELTRALDDFRRVEELTYDSADYTRRYRSDAKNGKGTVYGNAFSAYMRGRTSQLSAEQLGNLKSICGNPSQCATRALDSYEEAGKEFEECSFQGKRRLNNITDLLLRIGQHYNETVREFSSGPFGDWTRTPASLSDAIEHQIRNLMKCNSSDPFLSTFAITAAQGFGVSAKLKMQAGGDPTNNIRSAARYLRLANSFEPQNVPKEYPHFCFAVTDQKMKPVFGEALTSEIDGLPNADRLLEIFTRKCQ